jgi:hypothetical protein
MSSTTIRISSRSHQTLRLLAEERGETMQDLLEEVIERYRRQRFVEEANAEFAALRQDPAAWREEQAERDAWDDTLGDDLDDSST